MFIEWGEQIDVDRERLPYVWQYESLKGEIDQVVTYPGQPEKLSISTRYGILNSGDGGKTWFANAATGAGVASYFEVMTICSTAQTPVSFLLNLIIRMSGLRW